MPRRRQRRSATLPMNAQNETIRKNRITEDTQPRRHNIIRFDRVIGRMPSNHAPPTMMSSIAVRCPRLSKRYVPNWHSGRSPGVNIQTKGNAFRSRAVDQAAVEISNAKRPDLRSSHEANLLKEAGGLIAAQDQPGPRFFFVF